MADRKRSITENKVGLLGDNPSLQISPVKLDGTNYLSWSRSCLLFIQARGLKGYVTGEKPKPAIIDSTYNQREAENSLVMSWLINSMQPHISTVSLTYSQVGNDAQIYELRNKVHGTKQGEMTIAQYFAELSGLWQELDYYQEFQASRGGKYTRSPRPQANMSEIVETPASSEITNGGFSNEEESPPLTHQLTMVTISTRNTVAVDCFKPKHTTISNNGDQRIQLMTEA
ncbi:Retrotransposon Copia-like, N-terminal [Dillenia turbinata]|uniref:Retrotransposon Copia-like, N-terminal n=1 Tax=Dillenia turbinata TaxID=194707 RepID=A0AAN8Z2A7_9MAGN